jgi:hypothetical protein
VDIVGIVSIAGLAGRGVRVPVPQRSVPKEREPISKSIFKHNGMFTSPFTVFSQKVDMGSGFSGTGTHMMFRVPVPRNPVPISIICEKTVKGDVNIPLCLKMDKNGL